MWHHTLGLLNDLKHCNRLSRRSVTDDLESVAPKITWASAYNFLMSQGERCVSGTPFEIAFKTFRVISDIAYKKFVSSAPSKTTSDIESGVTAVSETALGHVNETLQAIIPNVNLLESLRRRYINEVVAGEAMLLALQRACRGGLVDTSVLAELSGPSELLDIDSQDTSIISINYDPILNQLTIVFDAKIDESWTQMVNWTLTFVVVGMLIILVAFATSAYHFIGRMGQVHKEAAKVYEDARRSSSVHQYIFSRAHYQSKPSL